MCKYKKGGVVTGEVDRDTPTLLAAGHIFVKQSVYGKYTPAELAGLCSHIEDTVTVLSDDEFERRFGVLLHDN